MTAARRQVLVPVAQQQVMVSGGAGVPAVPGMVVQGPGGPMVVSSTTGSMPVVVQGPGGPMLMQGSGSFAVVPPGSPSGAFTAVRDPTGQFQLVPTPAPTPTAPRGISMRHMVLIFVSAVFLAGALGALLVFFVMQRQHGDDVVELGGLHAP